MKRRKFLSSLAVSAGATFAASCRKETDQEKQSPAAHPSSSVDMVLEPAREVPVLGRTDVLVVGGGPAGVAAAVAAARAGAEVTVVERYNHLGGLWTGGLVLPLLSTHAVDKNGKFIRTLYGIGGEIEQRLRDMGMAIEEVNAVIDPEAGKYVLDVMMRDAGVKILYHAWAAGLKTTNNHIEAVFVESKSGRGAIIPKVIVDCTGDGDIFFMSGENYVTKKIEIGLVHRLGNTHLVDKNRPGYQKLNIGQPTPIPGVNWVNMNTGDPQDGLDAWNLSRLQQQYRLDIWEKFQKVRATPGYEKLFILDTASQLGVRVSRILDGEYQLSLEDSMKFRVFEDVVGISGAWTTILYNGHRIPPKKRPLWQIPYRSLLPKKTDNLLVAGRCFCFEDILLEDARIIGTCLVTGHAAGAAAAVAVQQNSSTKSVDIKRLQQLLRSQKANLG
jgi:ribulose 1,5-bisphosphate synthetase/thiazole synthase